MYLQTHCPNLALLDLSNITTMAVSHAVLPVEKLQTGCPKMKIFRVTNAQITLGSATLQEQVRIQWNFGLSLSFGLTFIRIIRRWMRLVFLTWRNFRSPHSRELFAMTLCSAF